MSGMRPLRPAWRAAAVALATALAGLVLARTPVGALLEEEIARRAEFAARQALGREPALDPRVQIFTWDDQTTELLKSWNAATVTDLPLVTWASVVEALAATKPQGIFIDKIFENPMGLGGADEFQRRVAALPVPVVAGAYLTEDPFERRLELADARYVTAPPHGAAVPAKVVPTARAYGPATSIEKAFKGVGHIVHEGSARMALLYELAGGRRLPHWTVPFFGGFRTEGGAVRLGPARIHVAPDGIVPINLLERRVVLARGRSFGWLLKQLIEQKPLDGLMPGDVIVIVPNFFTGNTDFKDTPRGRMEGALLQISVVNSLLRNDMLRPLPGRDVAIALAGAVAAVGALTLAPLTFWTLFFSLLVGGSGAALATFAFSGAIASWILPSLVFAAAGVFVSVDRQRVEWLARAVMEKDLELGRAAQSTFIPAMREGALGSWRFDVRFEPFGPVSGDWVQVFVAPAGRADGLVGAFAIGDVVGKGVAAALNTAVIASVWSRHARVWEEGAAFSAEILEELEGSIHGTFAGTQNSSIALALLYETHIEVCAAGTLPWALVLANGEVTRLKAPPCDPLGLKPKRSRAIPWRCVEVPSGATLVAFTDGVVDGSQAYTVFCRMLTSAGAKGMATTFASIAATALSAGAASAVPDDKTIVMLRREAA